MLISHLIGFFQVYSMLVLFWFCLIVLHQSWQRPCLARRAVNPEPVSFLDSEPDYVSTRPGLEVFGTRYYRHARHPSPEGLAEVCICFICVLSIWFSGGWFICFFFLLSYIHIRLVCARFGPHLDFDNFDSLGYCFQ